MLILVDYTTRYQAAIPLHTISAHISSCGGNLENNLPGRDAKRDWELGIQKIPTTLPSVDGQMA